ncbi:olfactory receptor 10C1-like [Ambystoma mexicanum]|uniref:olfactory receptor 10C1-like n=1 Tax=Ambystoma mexicanum TaxID=8296 RepID=UPI0037E79E6E
MALDRYVAICSPLRYAVQMNEHTCHRLAAGSWICGSIPCVVHTSLTWDLPFCSPREMNQFFCNIEQLLQLACTDTSMNRTVLFIHGGLAAFICTALILCSYFNIIATVVRTPAEKGHRKAFSTCASHLTAVFLFYGSGLLTNLMPSSRFSAETHKLVSIFYVALTPALNPIIYSLRNLEVKRALQRVIRKIQE